MHGKMGD